jgi:GNAT superfamily N-acetyltransferase
MNEKMALRRAVAADAGPIHELHLRSVRQLCREVYSLEIIEGWLRNRAPRGYLPGIQREEMYVAEIDGKIVGFGHAVPGQIEAIFVDPAFVRRGIGSKLMENGIKMAAAGASGTIKIESTLNARPLYEKFGFKVFREILVKRNSVAIPALEMYREIR